MGVLWFFFPKGERPGVAKKTSGNERAGTPSPEVESVKVPDPTKTTSGERKSNLTFEDITPSSTSKENNKKPKFAERIFVSPVGDSIATNWDKNGDGKVDGGFSGVRLEYWDKTKTILKSETSYENGKKHGPGYNYYKSGKTKTEFTYLNDEVDGELKRFYEAGGVKEETLFSKGFHDLQNGYMRNYFESGKMESETLSRHGHLTWALKMFHESGKLKSESPGFVQSDAQMVNLKGTESHYSKTGTLTRQILHDGKGGSKVVFDLEKGVDER